MTYIDALANTVDTVTKVGYGIRPVVPIEQLFLLIVIINGIFVYALVDSKVRSLKVTYKPIDEFIRDVQEECQFFLHELKTKNKQSKHKLNRSLIGATEDYVNLQFI